MSYVLPSNKQSEVAHLTYSWPQEPISPSDPNNLYFKLSWKNWHININFRYTSTWHKAWKSSTFIYAPAKTSSKIDQNKFYYYHIRQIEQVSWIHDTLVTIYIWETRGELHGQRVASHNRNQFHNRVTLRMINETQILKKLSIPVLLLRTWSWPKLKVYLLGISALKGKCESDK